MIYNLFYTFLNLVYIYVHIYSWKIMVCSLLFFSCDVCLSFYFLLVFLFLFWICVYVCICVFVKERLGVHFSITYGGLRGSSPIDLHFFFLRRAFSYEPRAWIFQLVGSQQALPIFPASLSAGVAVMHGCRSSCWCSKCSSLQPHCFSF